MSEHIDISEGTTGSNGVPAAIFGAAGVGLLTVSFVYSVLCFIICALFAGMKEGIEFRSKNKTYRKYFDCFGFRILASGKCAVPGSSSGQGKTAHFRYFIEYRNEGTAFI